MIRLTTSGIVGAASLCFVACLAGLATVTTAGCSATPPGAFIIVQNQVPNAADCTIPATRGNIYRGEGTLDVAAPGAGYVLFPLLENDFPSPVGSDVDGNRIALSGFDVEVGLPPNFEPGAIADYLTGLASLTPDDPKIKDKTMVQYSTLTSGTVSSGGGNTASSVVVFPVDLANAILPMLPAGSSYWVEANVRARGDTLTGSVRSDAFHYPIELCNGCLAISQGQCSPTTTFTKTCTPGQDSVFACCEQAGTLVCQ